MQMLTRQVLIIILISIGLMAAGCDQKPAATPQPLNSAPAMTAEKASGQQQQMPPSEGTVAGTKTTEVSPAPSAVPPARQNQNKPASVEATAVPAAEQISEKSSSTVEVSAIGLGQTYFKIEDLEMVEGDSVLAVTKRAAALKNVDLEVEGMGFAGYVSGIGGLREFDQGPMSGWIYKVNGESPSAGSGSYKLKAGDRVEWVYTTDGKRQ